MSIVYMLFVVRLLLIALLECIRVCYGVICRSVDTLLARVCSATLLLFSSQRGVLSASIRVKDALDVCP